MGAIGGDEGLLKGLFVDGPAGVGVAAEAGEVAARYLQSDPVTGQEHVGGRRQVQGDLVDVTALEELGHGPGVEIARPPDAVSAVHSAPLVYDLATVSRAVGGKKQHDNA